MSDAQRVIDDIGALVDAELAGGEPTSGRYPSCKECGGEWHGRPTGVCFGRRSSSSPMHIPTALMPYAGLIGSVRAQINRSWRWLG